MNVFREVAMLAEIFFLRLETMLRSPERAIRPRTSRFVPISADAFLDLREKQAGENGTCKA
jgi:hypothetical protein